MLKIGTLLHREDNSWYNEAILGKIFAFEIGKSKISKLDSGPLSPFQRSPLFGQGTSDIPRILLIERTNEGNKIKYQIRPFWKILGRDIKIKTKEISKEFAQLY